MHDLDHPFTANVRRVAAVTDFYGERVEKLLSQVEGDAVPAFESMLDDPRGALSRPGSCPLPLDQRNSMSWWIAAQIVRTVRQRERLQHIAGNGSEHLEVPQSIRSMAGRDEHVKFMSDLLARLGWAVFNRPWGLGFSDLCLWAGDVPVLIVNGQDDHNQLLATSYWDVVLPLDPHRFLILPGLGMREEDPEKRVDHRLKLDQGFGQIISLMIFEAANQQVYCHRDHDPVSNLHFSSPRLPRAWNGDTWDPSSWILDYPTMPHDLTVERRWLVEHLSSSAPQQTA